MKRLNSAGKMGGVSIFMSRFGLKKLNKEGKMKRLNSIALVVVVLALGLSVTGVYAADKAATAKPAAAAKADVAAAQATTTAAKAAPKAEAAKAAPKAETVKATKADKDIAQLRQEMEAQAEQFRREQIRREIAEGERGPRRDPQGEPIAIHNIQELQRIGNDENYPLDGNYLLSNDIDASETRNWNNGAGFDPIGDYNHPFTGRFNGDNHIISGLYIHRPHEENTGLFGFTGEGAVIENVRLVDVDMTGTDNVGGLVGGIFTTTISNSYVTGNVRVHGQRRLHIGGLTGLSLSSSISGSYAAVSVSGWDGAGGLVGVAYDSDFDRCYATGGVSGNAYVGGLMGCNFRSTITNSYATGNVSGAGFVGGLVGGNCYSSTITNSYATGSVSGQNAVGGLVGCNIRRRNMGLSGISNSYSTGSVSGTTNVGGLVGHNEGSVVSNSYATGRVESNGWHVGGLVGRSDSSPENYRNNYFDTETTGQEYGAQRGDRPNIAGIQGRTTAQMMQQATFEGWDFDDIWYIDEGSDYPRHKWELPDDTQQTIELLEGWNIISFYVIPDNMRMRSILQPLIDEGSLLMAKDERGQFMVRVEDEVFDNIGYMHTTEGYQIKVNQDTTLTVRGIAVRLPKTIPLQQGWNIISYPVPRPQPAMNVFQQLRDARIEFRVKDFRGNYIIYFNNNGQYQLFNNIGELQPGQGYKVLVDRDVDLIINAP